MPWKRTSNQPNDKCRQSTGNLRELLPSCPCMSSTISSLLEHKMFVSTLFDPAAVVLDARLGTAIKENGPLASWLPTNCEQCNTLLLPFCLRAFGHEHSMTCGRSEILNSRTTSTYRCPAEGSPFTGAALPHVIQCILKFMRHGRDGAGHEYPL